ncbi:hypothetical protein D0466_19045 [Peribacillus glennii]|uniref:Uncharacterized protein n=1 Tax=Peribacillus glennii TaxID=2303991 RepID=A0A372L8Q9_9BACI|nr:hypothetical protein D0466_19045 [Peribacillus glennii]
MQRRVTRKMKRDTAASTFQTQDFLTMQEMFERFMLLKKAEGLARRTIKDIMCIMTISCFSN